MNVIKRKSIVYIIELNKITLYMNDDCGVFLSKINNKEIKISLNSDRMLKKKFKTIKWDIYENTFSHIKFLIKYSPIFSMFVTEEDFKDITFEEIENISEKKYMSSFLIFNESKDKFFNVEDIFVNVKGEKILHINRRFLYMK